MKIVTQQFIMDKYQVTRETIYQWRATKNMPYDHSKWEVTFVEEDVAAWYEEFLKNRNKRKKYGPRKKDKNKG